MRKDEPRRLAEEQAHLHAEMLALNDAAVQEKRKMTAEEREQYDKMVADFEALAETRAEAERLIVQDREMQRVLNTPLEQRVAGSAPAGSETLEEYRKANGQMSSPADQPEYRDAFWHHLTADSHELDVEEQRALSKGTTTAGGFLVPTSMANEIIRSSRDMGAIAQLCNEIRTSGGETLNLPANTVHGTAAWTAESIAYTPSDETFANVALGAHKSTTKIIVSEELVADSQFGLEQFLATEFGERLGVLQNTAFVIGDGSGKPQGLLATDATANITLHTAAAGSSTAFTYTALVTAVFTLPRQYRSNAVFVVNDASARNLYLLLDSQNRPLWNVNVAADGPDTFLGYPIYTDPDLPAPAVSKISAIFGDLRRAYTVRRANGIGMQRQNELHSDNGQIGFRAYERVDGKVTLAAAALALKHSAT
jgi:HK97 family phage major capsid protein